MSGFTLGIAWRHDTYGEKDVFQRIPSFSPNITWHIWREVFRWIKSKCIVSEYCPFIKGLCKRFSLSSLYITKFGILLAIRDMTRVAGRMQSERCWYNMFENDKFPPWFAETWKPEPTINWSNFTLSLYLKPDIHIQCQTTYNRHLSQSTAGNSPQHLFSCLSNIC